MKKVLVLMLVLCMASLANAGQVLSLAALNVSTGVDTFTVSQTFGGTDAPDEAWLELTGALTFNYASAAFGVAAGTGGAPSGTAFVLGDGGYGAAWEASLNAVNPVGGAKFVPTPGSWSNGKLFSVNVANTLVGSYSIVAGNVAGALATVKMYGADGVTVVQTMSYVPEPATMLILGLGGLLLRRKKA